MEGELTALPVAMKADENSTKARDTSLLISKGCVWKNKGWDTFMKKQTWRPSLFWEFTQPNIRENRRPELHLSGSLKFRKKKKTVRTQCTKQPAWRGRVSTERQQGSTKSIICQRVHLKSPNGSFNNKETARNETKHEKRENKYVKTMTIISVYKTHGCTRLVSHCSWTNCMEDHLLKFSELVRTTEPGCNGRAAIVRWD
jgi:hypothetical protein